MQTCPLCAGGRPAGLGQIMLHAGMQCQTICPSCAHTAPLHCPEEVLSDSFCLQMGRLDRLKFKLKALTLVGGADLGQ